MAITYESGNYFVTRNAKGHYEVYRNGSVVATRCAYIGYEGAVGLSRAITECDRRSAISN